MTPKALSDLLGMFSKSRCSKLVDDVKMNVNSSSDTESSCNLEDLQMFTDHLKLTDRLKKTLYYGKLPTTERPSLPLTDVTLELFSKAVPNGGLGVLDMHYAASVSRRACISPCSMILAMMYLDQLRHKNPDYLQNVSSCDLFLISMLVASKFLYDDGEEDEVFNLEWASSANMDVKDLNGLEREFLAALNWEAFVKSSTFFNVLHEIECKIALIESSKRNWLSYTDIWVLSQGSTILNVWSLLVDGVVKVVIVSTIAYIAAVFTLFGASTMVYKCITPVRGIIHEALIVDNGVNQLSGEGLIASVMTSDSEVSASEISFEDQQSLNYVFQDFPICSSYSHRTDNIVPTEKNCQASTALNTLYRGINTTRYTLPSASNVHSVSVQPNIKELLIKHYAESPDHILEVKCDKREGVKLKHATPSQSQNLLLFNIQFKSWLSTVPNTDYFVVSWQDCMGPAFQA